MFYCEKVTVINAIKTIYFVDVAQKRRFLIGREMIFITNVIRNDIRRTT